MGGIQFEINLSPKISILVCALRERAFDMLPSFSRLHFPLLQRFAKKLFLPYYHVVSDERLAHIANLYAYKSISSFTKDVDWLCRNFSPISLQDVLDAVRNDSPLPRNPLHLSFDDGFSEIHSVVAPILKAKGVPATFFLVTDWIDNRTLFYRHLASILVELIDTKQSVMKKIADELQLPDISRENVAKALLRVSYEHREKIFSLARECEIDVGEYLKTKQPYLNTTQVQALMNDGFTIGSHSLDHPDFTSLTMNEQRRQILESIDTLRGKFSLSIRAFSFPFGDMGIGKSLLESLSEKVDLLFGSANMKRDAVPFLLHRSNIESASQTASALVSMQYARYLFRRATGKGVVVRH